MAYSDFFAERIRQRLTSQLNVEEKKMMGGLIFMVNGKMCVGVDSDKKTGEDRLMVRVGSSNDQSLLERPGSKPMNFTGKPMRGFIFVDPKGFDDDSDLDFWINKALDFNRSLIS